MLDATKHDWTDADIALLRERVAAGDSFGMIAQLIPGVTRNAVIGKARRLKLEQPRMRPRTLRIKAANPPRSPVAAHRAKGARNGNGALGRVIGTARAAGEALGQGMQGADKAVPFQPVIRDEDIAVIPLEALTNTTCRWPIGDPREEGFGFCGHAIVDGKSIHDRESYCARHKRRSLHG